MAVVLNLQHGAGYLDHATGVRFLGLPEDIPTGDRLHPNTNELVARAFAVVEGTRLEYFEDRPRIYRVVELEDLPERVQTWISNEFGED